MGSQVSAEKKWVDPNVDFSTWKKIILVDLKNGETKGFDGKIGFVAPELTGASSSSIPAEGYVKKEVVVPTEQKETTKPAEPKEVAKPAEPEKSAFAKAMEEKPADVKKDKDGEEVDTFSPHLTGFDAAQAQWKEHAQRKLGKKVQLILFADCLVHLQSQAPEIDWKKEWKEKDTKAFWELAGPYLKDYADGILYSELHYYGESTVYIPPTSRSVRVQQGGTFRNGSYYPNYVTQYYTTGGYDAASWNASATFGLSKIDGTPCWTYDKYSNKAKTAWFKTSNEEQYFSSFFARGLGESPLTNENMKADPDEYGDKKK